MNILRSVFISVFSGYIAFAFFYALLQLVLGMEPFFSWLGLALINPRWLWGVMMGL